MIQLYQDPKEPGTIYVVLDGGDGDITKLDLVHTTHGVNVIEVPEGSPLILEIPEEDDGG